MLHPQDFEHRYVRINSIRMHYAQAGAGPRLVVLLHGFPQCWWAWRNQLAQFAPAHAPDAAEKARRADLAARFTVIVPDLRGYNETDQPNWGYELDVLAQDVVELIRALGHSRAVVVGHDWGGVIAWALAIAHPHVVELLAILNAPHPARFAEELTGNWRQMLRSWYAMFFQLPLLPELAIRANDFAALERSFRGSANNPSIFSDQDIQIYKAALARPGALTAALNYYRGFMQRGPRGMFRGTGMRVAAPTQIVWGEDDIALGKELVAGTERFVPDLQVRFIPRCSHWVMEERPDLVNQYLLGFLDSRAGAPTI